MRKIVYIAFLLATQGLSAQTVTGSWYGRADVDLAGIHNNYLTELVIKQKGTRVEGIFGYYFRDKYESFFVHGRYNPQTREVIIQNIPVIYFGTNSTVNSIECITNFRGTLVHSRSGSYVTGTLYHDPKYKYLCPDLKVSYTLDKEDKSQDSLTTLATAAPRIWTPQKDDYVVDAGKPALQHLDTTALTPGSVITPVSNQPTVAAAAPGSALPLVKDSVLHSDTTAVAATPSRQEEDLRKISESFAKRKPTLNRILDVESDSVRLSFYDNGEIDGDSISVFVNNQVVLSHQELEAKALVLYLKLDSTRDLNEISMYAENLGKYPPNTALMVVTDGKNRYEVFMSSSLTENATVRIKRIRKP